MVRLQFVDIAVAAKYNLRNNTQCIDVHEVRLTWTKVKLSNHKCKIIVPTGCKQRKILFETFLLPLACGILDISRAWNYIV